MNRAAALLLLVWLGGQAAAQDSSRFIQTGFSANGYQGDLNSFGLGPGVSLALRFNYHKRLNGSFAFQYMMLQGEDANYSFIDPETGNPATPNRYFRTPSFSFSYHLHAYLLKTAHWWIDAGAGFGLFRYQPQDEQHHNLLDQPLTRAQNESYSNTAVTFPLHLEVSYFLPNNLGIGLKAVMQNVLTDYIDNISLWSENNRNDQIYRAEIYFLVPF